MPKQELRNRTDGGNFPSPILPLLALWLLAASGLAADPNTLTREEQGAGMRQLFNGESLRGWEAPGDNWVVEEGQIVRAAPGGDLYYRMYTLSDNFELRFEWKAGAGAVSGAAYRPAQLVYRIGGSGPAEAGDPFQQAGSIPGLVAAAKNAARPAGEWNESRVVCRGTTVEHWLNGEKVVDVNYAEPEWAEARARWKAQGADLETRGGYLRLLDRHGAVRYRSIYLQQLPPDNSPPLFQEDLLETLPIRTRLWQQITAYADSLPEYEREPAAEEAPLEARFRREIGFPPPGLLAKQTLRLEKSGEDALATYHHAFLQVTPQLEAYGLFIVPKNAKFPAPLMISVHGNAGYPEAALFHGGGNYFDLVRGPLSLGYVVYAPQMVVHAPRDALYGSPIPVDVLEQLDQKFRRGGTSLTAVEAARIIQALDALLARPEIDSKRVAMGGLSYGGYMTLRTAALDPRIKASVVSCGFFSRRSDPRAQVSYTDLPKLIAPRALQIQSGTHDPLILIQVVRTAKEPAEASYGSQGALDFVEFDGGHEFNGKLAWEFLKQHL